MAVREILDCLHGIYSKEAAAYDIRSQTLAAGEDLVGVADVEQLTLEAAVDGEREGRRTEEAADELYRDLQHYLPSALPSQTVEGDKGPLADLLSIVLALSSSGAVTQLIGCLRDWLARRPASRSVVIRDASGMAVLNVTAENVDDAVVVEALKAAAKISAG